MKLCTAHCKTAAFAAALLFAALFFVGCGEKKSEGAQPTPSLAGGESEPAFQADVDLTQLSSTMVFAEVYNMLDRPGDYAGKTVKMQGEFSRYVDEYTGHVYYAVLIADAAACCRQGMEFVWEGVHGFPADYPPLGAEIEVTGIFEPYEESGLIYCRILTDSIGYEKP